LTNERLVVDSERHELDGLRDRDGVGTSSRQSSS